MWERAGSRRAARKLFCSLETGRSSGGASSAPTKEADLAGGLGLGVSGFGLADFLDHAAANSCAAEAPNGLQVVLGVNDREPGYAVIEHGGGGDWDGVV